MSRLRSEPATEQLYTQIETGYESLDNEKNLFVRHIIASKMAAFEGERLYPYLEDLLSEIEAPPLSSNAKEKCLNLHVYVAKILAENSSVESWLLSYLQRIAADAEALGTTKGNRIARDARELIAELEEVKEED
jgi:hypothetical protein